MNRLNVIQRIIDAKKAQNYLEIGVSTGWLFFKVNSPFKIAVDPKFAFPWFNKIRRLFKLQKAAYFEVTSDSFFQNHKNILEKTGGIDVAFIDGLHTYEQAYRDVINCLKYLNTGGVILMHDCNPPNEACGWPASDIVEYRALASKGQVPGYLNSWNGDVWKAVLQLRSLHPELTVGTIDLDWGIGYVYRGESVDQQSFTIEQIKALKYSDLEKNRRSYLGLIPPSSIDALIHKITQK